MYFADQKIMQRNGRSWNAKIKYNNGQSSKSRYKNEIICLVIMFVPLKCQKWLGSFLYFLLMTEKYDKCNLEDILFSSFRKCYGSSGSELRLARWQTIKLQDLQYFLLIQKFFFFFDIYTLDISRTPKPINHTIFWKNSIRSSRCTKVFRPNCD